MSELFSLIKESSIPADIFSSNYSRERYIETSIQVLETVNEQFEEKTMALHKAIAEADSVKAENEEIKSFIAQIRQELTRLSFNIQTMQSKFAISLSNHCDSIKYQMDKYNLNILSNVSYKDNYIEFNKQAMLSSTTPRMRPHLIFEREFNFIAQLMQDLPITASNKDKLNVVATVCSKFNNIMANDIKSNLYEELFGDKDAKSVSFNEYMSSLFRKDSGERDITISEYSDAVECISSCDDFIESISDTTSDLISDLNRIINDLNNILFCGDHNKFKVDTKEDGIRNTIYSVDVYTSNKIMWLTQDKINQIVKVFNKYILALSIKMDSIIHYVEQSSDIINSFIYMTIDSGKYKDSDSAPDDTSSDDISDTPDDEPDIGGIDDTSNKEVTEEEEPETDDTDDLSLDGDDDMGDDSSDEEDTDYEVEESDEAPLDFDAKEDNDIREAFTEFYIAMHEYNMLVHESNIFENAASLLTEDGESSSNADSNPAAPSNTDSKDGGQDSSDKLEGAKKMVGKVADQKQSAWKSLIDNMVKLWNKFKENAIKGSERKIQYLTENEKYIKNPPVDAQIEKMPVIHPENIDKIQIPDLNYQAMKEHLNSEEDFINSQTSLKPFAPTNDEKNISKIITNSVISPTEQVKNAKDLDPMKLYGWCKNFTKLTDEIKKMTQVIENGERKAEQIAKTIQSESATNIEDMYFNEFTAGKDTNSNDSKCLTTYFSVCGKVLSAKMSVCHKVLNEYCGYLNWHIKKMKESKGVSSSDEGNTKEDKGNTGGSFN